MRANTIGRVIRHADPERDAAACAQLYAPFVECTVISLEDDPPGESEFAERISSIGERYPWLVLEDDEGLVGYAYGSQHRARAAYRWAVDVTVYVDASRHRRGAGRRLYEALFGLLRRQGYWIACAGITLPNQASVGFHEALGFEHLGTYRRIGWKFGAWHDVGWWQRPLLPQGGEQRPPEPLGPQRLGDD
jgi:L-amino acid N-acyltransferase YncA